MSNEAVKAFEKEKLAVIVRGIPHSSLLPLSEAVYKAGIRFMEITYSADGSVNDAETADGIKQLTRHFGKDMYIGAGTVLNECQVEMTAEAGGSFIISPDVNEAVIKKTKALSLMSMPGALTPTEIRSAHAAGADFVKLFPAGVLGAAYLRAITAPLSHIRLAAVGGINESNIEDFLNAGAAGFGIGADLAAPELIKDNRFGEITEKAKKYVSAVRKWQATYA